MARKKVMSEKVHSKPHKAGRSRKHSIARHKGPKTSSVFYVGIHNSADVRRNLLEAARESIHFLQRFERLQSVRGEKFEALQELEDKVKELRSLVNKLKKALPTAKFSENFPKRKVECVVCGAEFESQEKLTEHMGKHEQKKIKKVKVKVSHEKEKVAPKVMPESKLKEVTPKAVEAPTPPQPKPAKPVSDLEDLENELAAIEKKLGELA